MSKLKKIKVIKQIIKILAEKSISLLTLVGITFYC